MCAAQRVVSVSLCLQTREELVRDARGAAIGTRVRRPRALHLHAADPDAVSAAATARWRTRSLHIPNDHKSITIQLSSRVHVLVLVVYTLLQ